MRPWPLSSWPGFAADLDTSVAHPALLDLALHAGLPLLPDYEGGEDFYVPFSCQRVRLIHPLPRDVYSHVRLVDRHVAGGLVAFDVTIAALTGASWPRWRASPSSASPRTP